MLLFATRGRLENEDAWEVAVTVGNPVVFLPHSERVSKVSCAFPR